MITRFFKHGVSPFNGSNDRSITQSECWWTIEEAHATHHVDDSTPKQPPARTAICSRDSHEGKLAALVVDWHIDIQLLTASGEILSGVLPPRSCVVTRHAKSGCHFAPLNHERPSALASAFRRAFPKAISDRGGGVVALQRPCTSSTRVFRCCQGGRTGG